MTTNVEEYLHPTDVKQMHVLTRVLDRKVPEGDVRLDASINEAVWERGRSKPPSKLRVRAARFEEEGEAVVEAETAE